MCRVGPTRHLRGRRTYCIDIHTGEYNIVINKMEVLEFEWAKLDDQKNQNNVFPAVRFHGNDGHI